MRSFTRCGKSILTFALLFVNLFCAAAFAQEMEKPGVAVFVTGDIPGNERKVLGTYLLASIVNNGHGVSAENSDAFLATAMGDKQTVRDGAVNKGRICELGRQFNTRYVCVASVVPAFSFFVISTNMIDTETEEVIYKGEAQSPLKTIDDLTQVCNNLVVSMFGVETSNEQAESKPTPPQNDEPAAETASTTVVSVAGDAKAAVDRVVAAVNAFKAATNESIAAANAVKTATQSKSFSAIKEVKKKVESATEAVKKAKTDAEEAVEALKAAGPEAEAAAKALGIDLAMFAGKDGGGTKKEGHTREKSEIEKRHSVKISRRGSQFGVRALIGIGGLQGHNSIYLGSKPITIVGRRDKRDVFLRLDSDGDSVFRHNQASEVELGSSLSAGISVALLRQINDLLGISCEVQYSFYLASGENISKTDDYATVALHSLEVPALLRINGYPMYAEVGPLFGFNLYSRRTIYADKNLDVSKPNLNILTLGPVVGGGIDIDRISVGLRLYLGLIEYVNQEGGKPWSLSFSVASFF